MIPLSRILFAAALGVLPHLLVRTCYAQESPKPAAPPSKRVEDGDSTLKDSLDTLRVVALKHADSHSVVTTLKQLDVPLSASATGPQTVVLRGRSADVQKVIDTLIAAIDVPGVSGDSVRSAEFIPVRHYPIQEIGKLAQSVAPKSELGIDEVRRTIVVNGTDDEKRAVRDLLKEIDRPTQSLRVYFYFLRAAISGESAEMQTPLPQDLQPIGEALAENGFRRLSLIAPIVIGVEDGGRFESQGLLHLGDDKADRDNLQFRVKGVARLSLVTADAWLNLQAHMMGNYSTDLTSDAKTIFELDTTVATKLGNYVILAAAPSSTATGDAVALVIRLTAE